MPDNFRAYLAEVLAPFAVWPLWPEQNWQARPYIHDPVNERFWPQEHGYDEHGQYRSYRYQGPLPEWQDQYMAVRQYWHRFRDAAFRRAAEPDLGLQIDQWEGQRPRLPDLNDCFYQRDYKLEPALDLEAVRRHAESLWDDANPLSTELWHGYFELAEAEAQGS